MADTSKRPLHTAAAAEIKSHVDLATRGGRGERGDF